MADKSLRQPFGASGIETGGNDEIGQVDGDDVAQDPAARGNARSERVPTHRNDAVAVSLQCPRGLFDGLAARRFGRVLAAGLEKKADT